MISRRNIIIGLAAALATGASTTQSHAFFFSGEKKTLDLVNARTGEATGRIVYKQNGFYIPDALARLDHILRDWRRNETIEIDRRALDFLADVHELLETSEPLMVVSGYRSPATNDAMRRSRRGAVQGSLHTVGKAVDFSCRNRSVTQIYRAAMSLQRGGVGRYSGRGFIHIDSGSVRTWGS